MKKVSKDAQIVEFVSDLSYANYKEKKDIIIKSVNTIMSVSGLSIPELEGLTDLCVQTLRRILRKEKVGLFKTYSKLNMFVNKVIADNENLPNKASTPKLVIDALNEDYTGDIN